MRINISLQKSNTVRRGGGHRGGSKGGPARTWGCGWGDKAKSMGEANDGGGWGTRGLMHDPGDVGHGWRHRPSKINSHESTIGGHGRRHWLGQKKTNRNRHTGERDKNRTASRKLHCPTTMDNESGEGVTVSRGTWPERKKRGKKRENNEAS